MEAIVSPCAVPEGSLLDGCRQQGHYTDCFVTDIGRAVSHAEYVEAFYTTALFKTERLILAWLASAPSSDREARELAQGSRDSFAAWHVEARSENQLLMAVGRTKSWLMVQSGPDSTRLYFGSAVVPAREGSNRRGKEALGFAFGALLGFHNLYSRALLGAARSRLVHAVRLPPDGRRLS